MNFATIYRGWAILVAGVLTASWFGSQCDFIIAFTTKISAIKGSRVRFLDMAKGVGSKASSEVFVCEECGFEHLKWVGRCTSCKAWNTVKAFREAKIAAISSLDPARTRRLMPASSSVEGNNWNRNSPWLNFVGSNASLIPMETVDLNAATYRMQLFSNELNRVLGGGLVRGSVTLLAGDPGVGKSTLLLQLASSIASDKTIDSSVVYLSGEENPEQIAARAQRLGLSPRSTYLICDVDVDNAVENIMSMDRRPALIIVDSVQTMRTVASTGGMGTVPQIRESTARFVELAKTTGSAVLLIGHVTKSGDIAGPRVLEHMVDTVLYLEGSERSEYRLLRGVKNRFGSTAEVGVFAMTETGMEDVDNPSELFLSSSVIDTGAEGSAVAVVMEGSRPILAEIQCLVGTESYSTGQQKISPRRTSDGFPLQRLLLICAVIEKRLRLSLWSRDVFLNVVGGLRVFEPAADLAVAVTIVSSLAGMKIKAGTAFIGEIGLGGELRGVKNVDQRIAEAQKMGFSTVVVPNTGMRRTTKKAKEASSDGSKDRWSSPANRNDAADVTTGRGEVSADGVIKCSNLYQALTAALEVDSFAEITQKLRGGKRGKGAASPSAQTQTQRASTAATSSSSSYSSYYSRGEDNEEDEEEEEECDGDDDEFTSDSYNDNEIEDEDATGRNCVNDYSSTYKAAPPVTSEGETEKKEIPRWSSAPQGPIATSRKATTPRGSKAATTYSKRGGGPARTAGSTESVTNAAAAGWKTIRRGNGNDDGSGSGSGTTSFGGKYIIDDGTRGGAKGGGQQSELSTPP